MNLRRMKNRAFARLYGRFPSVSKLPEEALEVLDSGPIPWALPSKPLSESRVAIVTTAGLHLKEDAPFDMDDPSGDPTFRALPSGRPASDFTITHDYYDHSDAEKDINIVFPVQRLRELVDVGFAGSAAGRNFGFMGHIMGPKARILTGESAPQVARLLKEDAVDAVLLTPG